MHLQRKGKGLPYGTLAECNILAVLRPNKGLTVEKSKSIHSLHSQTRVGISNGRQWTPGNSQLTGRPDVVSVDGRLTGNLANNVSDAFRPHLGAVLAITWYFAVIARVECFRSTTSRHRDLAIQHHDAHVEIAVRMEIFGEIGFLTAINHLEPFAPQIALESLSRERPAIAAATGDIGDALAADLFGMQAAGGDFTTLPGTECFRVVVARYGDLAAKDEQSGVEVMTVVGFSRVRSQAGVDDAKAVVPECSLEFKTIH
jgi:hypothetical protein